MPTPDQIRALPSLDVLGNGYSRIKPAKRQPEHGYVADLYRDSKVDGKTLQRISTRAWQDITNLFPDMDVNQPPVSNGFWSNGYLYRFSGVDGGTGDQLIQGTVKYHFDLTKVEVRTASELLKNIVLRSLFPRRS